MNGRKEGKVGGGGLNKRELRVTPFKQHTYIPKAKKS